METSKQPRIHFVEVAKDIYAALTPGVPIPRTSEYDQQSDGKAV